MERQLRLYGTDLLAVAERCDRDRAIHVAKLRSFQKRQTGNTLASGQFKCVSNQSIVLVAADFHLVGVILAVVGKLSFYTGFSDQSI